MYEWHSGRRSACWAGRLEFESPWVYIFATFFNFHIIKNERIFVKVTTTPPYIVGVVKKLFGDFLQNNFAYLISGHQILNRKFRATRFWPKTWIYLQFHGDFHVAREGGGIWRRSNYLPTFDSTTLQHTWRQYSCVHVYVDQVV